MHRSGTSAVAGALGRCGIALGDRLIEGAPDNPGGYFEHADAVLADEGLLAALGRAWDDVRRLPGGWEASPAAGEAADAIASRVLAPFRGESVWAVKDPRMCRLLPLWLRVLGADGVEPLGLLVLRHPDEVAASLARRDAMHARAANLLWIRHTLEAAEHAPPRSIVVTYDRFLADPAACLRHVATALDLPIRFNPGVLDDFVDPSARHHLVDASTALDEIHALALDAHAELASPAWREALPGLLARLESIEASQGEWIDALGAAALGADRRRRHAADAQLGAERRAETLQQALDRATGLASQHVRELAELDAANRQLQAALADAEALVKRYGDQAAELDGRLGQMAEALARAESLVDGGQADLHLAHDRIHEVEAALAQVEALAIQREHDLRDFDARIAAGEDALRRAERLLEAQTAQTAALESAKSQAEAIAAERLEFIERLDAAKAVAERIAHERLQELQVLADTLARVETLAVERLGLIGRLESAKAVAEQLAHERLDEMQALADALARAEAVAAERLVEIDTLRATVSEHGRLAEAQQDEIHGLRREGESRGRALADAHTELARIRGSRLWWAYRRLARLTGGVERD
ncbi:hypothetical protein [Cognatilysobacter segetis]|uniref:hypothetical protein n=1 Tax=Cognatilysobacter segetis TaxID=2492394 RepID=UPI00105E4328|nr:hypothetical protein [Lysobacter segetis]